MLAALASGCHGPRELTFGRAVTSGTLDPWSLAGIVILGGLYLMGVRRVRRNGERWPIGRIVLFCGLGLGFGIIATMSFVGVYQPVLFYIRSVQTVLLLLVVPLFLALGRPLTLAIEALPGFGSRLESAVGSRVARVATFPAITTVVLVLTPFVIYFTPWDQAGVTSALVAPLTHIPLIAPGFAFFLTLLRLDP